MSEQLTLPAEARDRAGKGASRALRRDGRVPAVVYGEKKEPLSIHVEEKLLTKMLSTGHFMNSVVMIDFKGKPHRTLPKAVDFHPVTSRPIHVDFLRIGEHTKVHVAVPMRFDNEEAFAWPEARRRLERRRARARAGLRRGPTSRTRSTSRSMGWRSAIRSTSARSSCPTASCRRTRTKTSPSRRSSRRRR